MPKKVIKLDNLKDIEETFIQIGGNKAILGLKLLSEAMFCEKTLDNLKKQIEAEGTTSEMCQGAYSITRESPALRSYNTLIKNYQSLIKQINELLGEQISAKEKDDLEEFLSK